DRAVHLNAVLMRTLGKGARRRPGLPLAYAHGDGVEKGDKQALELSKQACSLNEPAGCRNAGIMIAKGQGSARDDREAAGFMNRACVGGDATACELIKQFGR